MHRIVSADLAYRAYRDTGIAILEADDQRIDCAFVDAANTGMTGLPAPEMLAEFLSGLAEEVGATILLLDGPQAWKDPENGLEHSRHCERALHTPAKTGIPGVVKPGNYLPFVAFAIAVFDSLAERGWPRYTGDAANGGRVVVESFPMSAWRSLGLPILPAKAKSRADDLETRVEGLRQRFPVRIASAPNHDELQALVSGLAGVGLMGSRFVEFISSGVAPYKKDGVWREGFIVNPAMPADDRVQADAPFLRQRAQASWSTHAD
jgi:hypothetical protein